MADQGSWLRRTGRVARPGLALVALVSAGMACGNSNKPQKSPIQSSNNEAWDQFGGSVALSGDLLAVGAPFESSNAAGVNGKQKDNSADSSGAVYVFRRADDSWSQEAYLKASNPDPYDNFGMDIAFSGNLLAVSARSEASSATGINGDQADNGTTSAGAVYVFRRQDDGTWIQEAYLKASNTSFGAAFGSSLALAGDTLAVGAVNEDSGATGVNGNQEEAPKMASGAVYVFRRQDDGTWTQEAYIKASNTSSMASFGSSVALSGDTLAVGARNEAGSATGVNGNQDDDGAQGSGAVYVFRRQQGTWTQEAYRKASNTGAGDGFGWNVALAGDTLAVSAIHEASSATGVNGNQADDGASKAGAVYVFRRDDGAWAQEAYLKASSTSAEDLFGYSIALAGDKLAVGTPYDDSNGAKDGGVVYVFQRTDGTWAQKAQVKSPAPRANELLGYGLALTDDALAAGAPAADTTMISLEHTGEIKTNEVGGALGKVYIFSQ